jgi:ATP-dependent Zn protease
MNRSHRGLRAVLAALATCLALLIATAIANPPQAAARFQRESFTVFQQQLNSGQIQSATFNKRAHTIHLTLHDGRLVLVSYPSHEEPQLAALLRAKGVSVTVQKKKKVAAKVHHTLRYIAGGIVVIVILVVAAVLLVDRRRKLGEEAAGPSPPGPSPPGPSPTDPSPPGGSPPDPSPPAPSAPDPPVQ